MDSSFLGCDLFDEVILKSIYCFWRTVSNLGGTMRIYSSISGILLELKALVSLYFLLLRVQKIILFAYILVAQFFNHFVPLLITSYNPFLFLVFPSWFCFFCLLFLFIGIRILFFMLWPTFGKSFDILLFVGLLFIRRPWLLLSAVVDINQLADDVLSGSIVSWWKVLFILGLFFIFLHLDINKGL